MLVLSVAVPAVTCATALALDQVALSWRVACAALALGILAVAGSGAYTPATERREPRWRTEPLGPGGARRFALWGELRGGACAQGRR
jgi:hypothetical protein